MKLDAMKTEAGTLRVRIMKDRERLQYLQQQVAIEERRQTLSNLVRVESGVTVSYGASRESLRGRKATVLKVNRKTALVAIDGEEWLFPFDLLHTDDAVLAMERMLYMQQTLRQVDQPRMLNATTGGA